MRRFELRVAAAPSGLEAALMAAVAVAVARPPPSSQQEKAAAAERSRLPKSEYTPKTRRAIERGLAWLAQQQKSDGSFGSGSQYGRHVGITALAALAFMSNGDMPGRGRYSRQVEKALKFILDSTAEESGLICAETSYGPMYGHGF